MVSALRLAVLATLCGCTVAEPHYVGLDGGSDGDNASDAVAVPTGMVLVPAGAFGMGCNVVAGCGPYPGMTPYHEVTTRAFAIDREETSVASYYECLNAGVCTEIPTGVTEPTSDLPVSVSWQGAVAYCAYQQKRLPTEAEWEKAARSY